MTVENSNLESIKNNKQISNSIFRLLTICFLLFFASSCDNDSDSSDSDSDSGSSNSDCFFEFTLDGVSYSSNDCISSTIVYPVGMDDLIVFGANLTNNEIGVWLAGFSILVHANETLPFQLQYPLESSSDGVNDFNLIFDTNSIFATGDNTEGSFTITELAQSDGWIEGDFEFTDMDEQNKNTEVISTGHTITNGHFRLKVD